MCGMAGLWSGRQSCCRWGLKSCAAGVRLRNNKEAGPPPDEEDDLGLPFFETQLCAAFVSPSTLTAASQASNRAVACPVTALPACLLHSGS